MKFSTREDIEAPAEEVFRAISDFRRFERLALRHGIEVQRAGRMLPDGTRRLAWQVDYPFRGRRRSLAVELAECEAPERLVFTGRSEAIRSELAIVITALPRERCRMGVQLDMRPRSIPARLFIQSLKLIKPRLTRRFRRRVRRFVRNLERGRQGGGSDQPSRRRGSAG